MFLKNRKGQSILEYAILLGVIIAALLVMQFLIKRGFQGGLKDSADKLGEQFSAGNTTTQDKRELLKEQVISDNVATTGAIKKYAPEAKPILKDDLYSLTERPDAQQKATTVSDTDSLKKEKTRLSEYQDVEAPEIPLPDKK
jgi:Flp pilus assembly pilin Flp